MDSFEISSFRTTLFGIMTDDHIVSFNYNVMIGHVHSKYISEIRTAYDS